VLPFALSTLCCALLAPAALAAETLDEHAAHTNELSPTVITAIAPSSPLTIVTNPKTRASRCRPATAPIT
jgi:iron complex outermembrane receptor protein